MSINGTLFTLYADATIPRADANPFGNVKPDFTVFGAKFTHMWQVLLGGVWGIAIVYCGYKLIMAGMRLQSAKTNGYAQSTLESTDDLKRWGLGTGVILTAGVIFGAALAITQ